MFSKLFFFLLGLATVADFIGDSRKGSAVSISKLNINSCYVKVDKCQWGCRHRQKLIVTIKRTVKQFLDSEHLQKPAKWLSAINKVLWLRDPSVWGGS